LTSYELSGWTSRIHWPNHRSPKMYQAHPSALAPMIATTAITIDKIASLRMALPTTVAGRKARPPENEAGILHCAGFSGIGEDGVGSFGLKIAVKRAPIRPEAVTL
jgi:hypothetical protein